jgi:hypothetical protein
MLMFMGFENLAGCPCPRNLLLVSDNMAVHGAIMTTQRLLGILLAGAVAAIAVRRWQRASPPLRRALAPILVTGGATSVLLAGTLLAQQVSTPTWAAVSSAERIALALVPIAYLLGLVRARLGRAAVSDLVVELGGTSEPGRLRDALARALRDPSLELAYWVPATATYVGIDGRRVDPHAPPGRVVTVLERHGRRIAALVHDPALAEDPALLEAVSTAAGLALEERAAARGSPSAAGGAPRVAGAHRRGRRHGAAAARTQPPRRRPAAARVAGPVAGVGRVEGRHRPAGGRAAPRGRAQGS